MSIIAAILRTFLANRRLLTLSEHQLPLIIELHYGTWPKPNSSCSVKLPPPSFPSDFVDPEWTTYQPNVSIYNSYKRYHLLMISLEFYLNHRHLLICLCFEISLYKVTVSIMNYLSYELNFSEYSNLDISSLKFWSQTISKLTNILQKSRKSNSLAVNLDY